MNIQTCTPTHLPPKQLDWERLTLPLGETREHLARYDETLRPIPPNILEILKWEDSIATIRSQNIETDFREILLFALEKNAEEKRAALLQKVVYAKEGLDFSIDWALKKPLNLTYLCQLHAILKQDVPNPKDIGKLRDRQNWIGPPGCSIEEAYFFPPKAALVPKYLANWQVYSRKKEEPLIQLAILVAQLLIIHPFMDGNGRVARNYIPAFLYKRGLLSKPYLFVSSYFENHRLQYLEKLYRISEKNDWEDWILYFLKAIAFQAHRMKLQAEKLHSLYLKVREEKPFIQPISLRKKKILTENSKGSFEFKPLFEAIR